MANAALVVSLQGIGNALLALPLANALRQGGHDVDLLTLSPRAVPVLAHAPFVRDVIAADDASYTGWRGRLRLLAELRRRHYDTAVFSFPSGANAYRLIRAAGIPARIGHRYAEVGRAAGNLTAALPTMRRAHDLEHNLQLAEHLGLPHDPAALWPVFFPSARLQDKARNYLAEHGVDPLQLHLGLHTGCDGRWVEKRWPEHHFARLAELVYEKHGLSAVVLDGPGEPGSGRRVAQLARTPVHALDGWGDLTDAWALIACCKIVVSNDSGLMNLAAASGVPTVAVFGPSEAHRTRPFGPRGRIVVAQRPCAPCFDLGDYSGCPYPHSHCLNAVTPESVLAAVEELLN
ncbi:MAG: glycosyltransferase family 9 protein [Candidatus Lernaella stagnicola]|nr:glycosyltransferase family 9 protein [Candidatus Lernaella stagnicola]